MNQQQTRPTTIGEADLARYWTEHIPEAQQVLADAGHGIAANPLVTPPNARKAWWVCTCGSRHNTPRGVGQHWAVMLRALIARRNARPYAEVSR